MRGVAFSRWPGGLLAGSTTLLVAVTAISAESVATEAAVSREKAAKAAADDYYTRRARNILDAERAAAMKPHPLAATYPGKEIVVCEAGCPERTPQVVFIRPEIPKTVEASEGVMVPTASSDGRAVPTDQVACVAGCYGAEPAVPAATPIVSHEGTQPNLLRPSISIDEWTPPLRERKTIDDKLSPVR